MKKVENLNIILDIIKSEKLSNNRKEFMEKFSVDSDSIFIFNSNFSKWRKAEIDTKEFVDLVVSSKLNFDIDNFSIFDLIVDFLKIHLYPIKDLIDENPDDVINVVINLKDNYISSELNIGSYHNTPELSDDVYNPFDDPNSIIDEVVNVLKVKFSNEEFRSRFYDICIKFIKNIRNKIQTFDILTKSKKDNGVGLKQNIADEVLNKIEKIKKQAEDSLLPYVFTEKSSTKSINNDEKINDLDIDEEDKDHIIFDAKNISNELNSNKKIVEEYQEGDMKFHIFDGSVEEMYLNQLKNKEEISDMNTTSDFKKRFENIKLIGPIEELAFFTIRDFRNLSQNVDERIEKISDKIQVLSSYSARKRVLGIKAWLVSEVCIVYKKMIDESVKYGSMSYVINLRRESGDLYLTQEEIDVVAQLNRKLRI